MRQVGKMLAKWKGMQTWREVQMVREERRSSKLEKPQK